MQVIFNALLLCFKCLSVQFLAFQSPTFIIQIIMLHFLSVTCFQMSRLVKAVKISYRFKFFAIDGNARVIFWVFTLLPESELFRPYSKLLAESVLKILFFLKLEKH